MTRDADKMDITKFAQPGEKEAILLKRIINSLDKKMEFSAQIVAVTSRILQTHSGDFFLAPKYLAPCRPLVAAILPILMATLSATGPIILRPSGALVPTSEAISPTDRWGHCTLLRSAVATIHRKHCFQHRKRFLSQFWVRPPGVRCAPYPGTIIQCPPPPQKKTPYMSKTPNSPPPQAPPPPPSPVYKVH